MTNQRGDTIIEVIFAVTVFSMVAIGGLSLMNQGAAMAQRSLEISQVRDQMDAQADALRYLHTAYLMNYSAGSTGSDAPTTKIWKKITSEKEVTTAQTLAAMNDNGKCKIPDENPFALNIRKLDTEDLALIPNDNTATYAQIQHDDSISPPHVEAQGIWIQVVHGGTTGTPGYYDFHVRACWFAPGQQVPVTLGTIVRLYDPAA